LKVECNRNVGAGTQPQGWVALSPKKEIESKLLCYMQKNKKGGD
jgi:hypothetical protein